MFDTRSEVLQSIWKSRSLVRIVSTDVSWKYKKKIILGKYLSIYFLSNLIYF